MAQDILFLTLDFSARYPGSGYSGDSSPSSFEAFQDSRKSSTSGVTYALTLTVLW